MTTALEEAIAAPAGTTELRRFVSIAWRFCVGLLLVAAVAEFAFGIHFKRTNGRRLIGKEVYAARMLAARGGDAIRTIYLGDSVARQLFPPGTDDATGIASLTTNQAISLAGQYYLLRDALETHRRVTDVVLIYGPASWSNNLDQVFTNDYFCGYFHDLDQVRDAFRVTSSWPLLFAHLRRALIPNLSAANSAFNIDRTSQPGAPSRRPASADPMPIAVSKVSTTFLAEMRRLTSSRGIALHVYPAPVSDAFRYRDAPDLYDAPILYLPKSLFQPDTVHVQVPYIEGVRHAVAGELSLPTDPWDRGRLRGVEHVASPLD